MSYEQALRELTDAGYQPTVACGFQSDISAGQVIEGLRWQPAGQRDRFNHDHVMFVLNTPLAAPGPNPWANLDTLPGVITENQHTTVTCPSLETGPTNITPQPGVTTVFIPSELASPSYARVSFATTVDYDAALLEVTDLGVRLGDYCYETGLAASNHGKTLWHPMGQEGEYASSHTLTLAPMALTTAHTWLDQLGAILGVTGVQANYTPTC